jgi:hypothetical protein
MKLMWKILKHDELLNIDERITSATLLLKHWKDLTATVAWPVVYVA